MTLERKFKLKWLTKGAQKAHRRMAAFYGPEEGERIFLEKADRYGEPEHTLRQKVNDTYKHGAKLK